MQNRKKEGKSRKTRNGEQTVESTKTTNSSTGGLRKKPLRERTQQKSPWVGITLLVTLLIEQEERKKKEEITEPNAVRERR